MSAEHLNEDLKKHAVSFAKWIDDNCTKSFIDRYFFDEPIVGHRIDNDFSIEELYDIFIHYK